MDTTDIFNGDLGFPTESSQTLEVGPIERINDICFMF